VSQEDWILWRRSCKGNQAKEKKRKKKKQETSKYKNVKLNDKIFLKQLKVTQSCVFTER
jgi:hypothetical protein